MKTLRPLGGALALLGFSTLCGAFAQTSVLSLRDKLAPIDPLAGQELGISVSSAVNNNFAVLGAPLDKHLSSFGAAYVFDVTLPDRSAYWQLTPTGAVGDAMFGNDVAVSGDHLIVGAFHDDAFGLESGSAFVFQRIATEWTQQAQLHPSDPSLHAEFGWSVAMTDTTAVIGARHSTGPDGAGAVYVFELGALGWNQTAKLVASDAANGANFGWSVAIENDRIIVGAPTASNLGVINGSIYVFERSGLGNWLETGKIFDPSLTEGAGFGHAVALSGDTVAVGQLDDTFFANQRGSVYTYRLKGFSWRFEARQLPREVGLWDNFGDSVAIEGSWLVVGSPKKQLAGLDSGAVFFYERVPQTMGAGGLSTTGGSPNSPGASLHGVDRLGQWMLQGIVMPADLGPDYRFGTSVAVCHQLVLVGAPGAMVGDVRSGAGYLFESWSTGGLGGAYCFGDNSGAACPCGNPAARGAHTGCANSLGVGAKLAALGSRSIFKDDLVCSAYDMPYLQLSIMMYAPHSVAAGQGIPFNSGLLCLGTPIVGTDVKMIDAFGHAAWGPNYAAEYGWTPGQTWHFQVWYQDAKHGACETPSNTTNAFEITFLP